ncbi:unnamed protein product [Sphagnum jensenii]|uniref:Uncharacterized protein n=1 Tax=Sphagnum jensenii TaxID=128206 RepID=A0ABP1ADV5_9BRYO
MLEALGNLSSTKLRVLLSPQTQSFSDSITSIQQQLESDKTCERKLFNRKGTSSTQQQQQQTGGGAKKTKRTEAATHTAMERRPSSSCFSCGHHAIKEQHVLVQNAQFCTQFKLSLDLHKDFAQAQCSSGERARKIKMRNRGNMR